MDKINCSCKASWEKECIHTSKSLKERINDQLDRVELIIENYSPKNLPQDRPVRHQRIINGNSQK